MINRLVEYVEKADYHLTTGFLTTQPMFGILCDSGYADLAWQMFRAETYPSWKYMIQTGATTITETWKGITEEDPWGSLNHFALGSICSWFFEYLGGIRVNESKPGLKKIILKPVFIEEVGQFEICYKTKNGIIKSQWEFREGHIEWKIHVPSDTVAEIYLPGKEVAVKNSGAYVFYVNAIENAHQIVLKK